VSPEITTDLLLTGIMLLAAAGMIFQGRVLKAAQNATVETSLETLHKRGAILQVCGAILLITQLYKLGSILI